MKSTGIFSGEARRASQPKASPGKERWSSWRFQGRGPGAGGRRKRYRPPAPWHREGLLGCWSASLQEPPLRCQLGTGGTVSPCRSLAPLPLELPQTTAINSPDSLTWLPIRLLTASATFRERRTSKSLPGSGPKA